MLFTKRYIQPALCLTAALALQSAASAVAAPADLSTFSYESVGDEVWQLNGGGTSVTHTSNNMPSVFFSGTNDLGSDIGSVSVRVDDIVDDDFVGFVFGFNSGDFSNLGANYLLLDWKQGDQTHDFPGGSERTTAVAGLALSRVTGVPTIDEFWGHVNSDADAGGGVQELSRATNLGNTGWVAYTPIDFDFFWTADELQVFVDGVLEIAVETQSSPGSFGFYAFSQDYATFSVASSSSGAGPQEVVTEPATLALFGILLAGFGMMRRRIVG